MSLPLSLILLRTWLHFSAPFRTLQEASKLLSSISFLPSCWSSHSLTLLPCSTETAHFKTPEDVQVSNLVGEPQTSPFLTHQQHPRSLHLPGLGMHSPWISSDLAASPYISLTLNFGVYQGSGLGPCLYHSFVISSSLMGYMTPKVKSLPAQTSTPNSKLRSPI